MIDDFVDKETEKLFTTSRSKKFPAEIIKTALRKLDYLDKAKTVRDLRIHPGNKLEQLKMKF